MLAVRVKSVPLVLSNPMFDSAPPKLLLRLLMPWLYLKCTPAVTAGRGRPKLFSSISIPRTLKWCSQRSSREGFRPAPSRSSISEPRVR